MKRSLRCASHRSSTVELGRRQRDLFPLGLLTSDELVLHWPSLADWAVPALDYLNGAILGLNWLYGLKASALVGRRHSGLQLAALDSVVASAVELHAHLGQSLPERGAAGWSHFERGATVAPLHLNATAVAVPDCAGTCNPSAFVAPEAWTGSQASMPGSGRPLWTSPFGSCVWASSSFAPAAAVAARSSPLPRHP